MAKEPLLFLEEVISEASKGNLVISEQVQAENNNEQIKIENSSEQIKVENNDEQDVTENHPIYNWIKNYSWIIGLIVSFVAFVLSAMWFARDKDFEPALALLGSLVTIATIIFNRGIKGFFFILGFLLGITLAAFLFYLLPAANKNSNSSPSNQSELANQITDFKVVRDFDRTIRIEAWYLYSGDLGLENVLLHPVVYDGSGEVISMRTVPGEIIVKNSKAIATMELTYLPVIEGNIKKSTEIRLCIMTPEKGWLHCQNFPYDKIWK